MEDVQIALVPCLTDNYAVLMHVPATGATILVDAPDAQPIAQVLTQNNWKLTCILITHHHSDHIDGLMMLKAASNATVVGPALDKDRIPGLDVLVADGDEVNASGLEVKVIATPGHTSGHVSYWFPKMGVVFTADTLFALGCGRIFEGTPQIMWESLKKLAALPPETTVFCGHEYTLSNARFAVTVDPHNKALEQRVRKVMTQHMKGEATIPTTIGDELATNPFLRAGDPAIAERLGMVGKPEVEVFAELRRRKDSF